MVIFDDQTGHISKTHLIPTANRIILSHTSARGFKACRIAAAPLVRAAMFPGLLL